MSNSVRGAVISKKRGISSPLSLPFDFLYWCSGPEYGDPADGASMDSWVDEIGTFNATWSGVKPLHRDAVAGFNNKPALDFSNFSRLFTPNTTQSQPITIVSIARYTTWTEGNFQLLYDGTGGVNRLASLINTTLTPDQEWLFSGAGTLSGGVIDANTHLRVNEHDSVNSRMIRDGSVVISGDSGSQGLSSSGLWIGIDVSQSSVFLGHMALFGGKWGKFSSGNLNDLLTWSRSFYATP